MFKNYHCIYDSIIMAVPNDIKTEKLELSELGEPEDYGYGNPTVHAATDGLVFDNLKLLKHYFEGAKHFTSPPPCSDENEYYRNLNHIKNGLSLKMIKLMTRVEGAYNLGLYNHECGYKSEISCYQNYLLFKKLLNMEGK